MPSFKHLPTITLALLLALGVNYALAYSTWVGPTADAPGNNVDAPLNISSTAQTKTGALSIANLFDAEGLLVDGNSIFHGSVQIEDGTEGLDKVLASDAEGNAAWTDINDLIGDGAGSGGGSSLGGTCQLLGVIDEDTDGTNPAITVPATIPSCFEDDAACRFKIHISGLKYTPGSFTLYNDGITVDVYTAAYSPVISRYLAALGTAVAATEDRFTSHIVDLFGASRMDSGYQTTAPSQYAGTNLPQTSSGWFDSPSGYGSSSFVSLAQSGSGIASCQIIATPDKTSVNLYRNTFGGSRVNEESSCSFYVCPME